MSFHFLFCFCYSSGAGLRRVAQRPVASRDLSLGWKFPVKIWVTSLKNCECSERSFREPKRSQTRDQMGVYVCMCVCVRVSVLTADGTLDQNHIIIKNNNERKTMWKSAYKIQTDKFVFLFGKFSDWLFKFFFCWF